MGAPSGLLMLLAGFLHGHVGPAGVPAMAATGGSASLLALLWQK
jgi:hypothetical protein